MISRVIDVERVVAVGAGEAESPRQMLLEMPARAVSAMGLDFHEEGRYEILYPRTITHLTGFASRGQGRVINLGVSGTPKLFRNDIAERIRANFYVPRREEFKTALLEGLIGFVDSQGVIYDSWTYEFTNEWADDGETVRLVGYIEDIPSFMLVAGMWNTGILSKLSLYPGVLVDQRYPVNITPVQALAIAKTREPTEYPLSWDNVVMEYTYTDLREPGSLRNAAFDTPYGRREAYPHILVRACRETPRGRQFQESYFIDAVQGKIVSVLPTVLYMGEARDEMPAVISLREVGQFKQGIKCTPPPVTRFEAQQEMDLCGFGSHLGAWSTCGQYAKFDFGVYKVTPCPTPQS
ncbi:MAG: hypothetical protein KF812_11360 [Fimbriimonadaceae bacterium]|nr:hypothetical protein [Fimbriimonadaceae bacterium]